MGMELQVGVAAAVLLVALVGVLGWLAVRSLSAQARAPPPPNQAGQPVEAAPGGGRRRGAANRMQAGLRRRRQAAAAAEAGAAQEEEEGADSDHGPEAEGHAAQGEGAPRVATRRDAYEEQRRKKDEQREALEAAQEAEMKRAEAERIAAENAEAERWRDLITVEGAGSQEAGSAQDGRDLLEAFVDFIKERKTVMLEELGAEFNLRVTEVIDRVRALETDGRLSGLMDDRGKYIYISREEMVAVADFIKRRGRVAIAELAARSNDLIDLQPRAMSQAAADLADLDLGPALDPPHSSATQPVTASA